MTSNNNDHASAFEALLASEEGADPAPAPLSALAEPRVATRESRTRHGNTLTLLNVAACQSTHNMGLQFPPENLGTGEIVVLQADEQLGGVGQHSNAWSSPVGNLYTTFVFKRPAVSVQFQFFPILCMMRTLEGFLERAGVPLVSADGKPAVELKWINDLFLVDRKVCGVLLGVTKDATSDAYVHTMSMGVNLNVAPVPEISSCLREAMPSREEVDVHAFCSALCDTVLQLFDMDDQTIIGLVRDKLRFLNERVEIRSTDLSQVLHEGVFTGIDDYGFALLRKNDSEIPVKVMEGRMRRPAGGNKL